MTRQQRQQKDQRQGQGVSKSTAGHHQLPRACNGNIGGLEHGPVGAKAYSIVQAAAPVERVKKCCQQNSRTSPAAVYLQWHCIQLSSDIFTKQPKSQLFSSCSRIVADLHMLESNCYITLLLLLYIMSALRWDRDAMWVSPTIKQCLRP